MVEGEDVGLVVDFPNLSLEQQYRVEVWCYLGELEVDCSWTKKYTGKCRGYNHTASSINRCLCNSLEVSL